MYYTKRNGGSKRPSQLIRHVSSASQDTNASGIAESTMSYGESLRLSQFPNPPALIPTTPILSESGASSPNLGPRGKKPPASIAGSSTTSSSGTHLYRKDPPVHSKRDTTHGQTRDVRLSSATHALSPYDWHDGASSITMDAAEDRLLSTSFITSLLQENAIMRRTSIGSDAMSGFSEMTYPPLASSYHNDDVNYPSSSRLTRTASKRPRGARSPRAFLPIPESLDRQSDDSDTLHSGQDHSPSILGMASVSRLPVQGASVVGIAPATLHNVSFNKDTRTSHHDPSRLTQYEYTSVPWGSAFPTTVSSPARFPSENSGIAQNRESVHSSRSTVSSFISRLSSHRSVRRVLAWRGVKPLPPVPTIPHIPVATEIEHRRADELRSLPDLVNRAGALQGLLEKGHHPHKSIGSYVTMKEGGLVSVFDDSDTIAPEVTAIEHVQNHQGRRPLQNLMPQRRRFSNTPNPSQLTKRKRVLIIIGGFLIVALAAVGAAVGITLHRKGNTLPLCSGDLVGAACNLNATCVCTSTLPERCDPLAQNLIDLIPMLNQAFSINQTSNVVYNNVWLAQGTPPKNNCAQQSRLVDVAPALDPHSLPELTKWAQVALLWHLVESQDLQAVEKLQKFILNAPWNTLGGSGDQTAHFSTTVLGYTFNFATQEITQPNISFVTYGQPTAAQLAQVNSVAQSALDRMYSFAGASSTQRQTALANYWTTTLQQKATDLPIFVSAFSSSPIFLPFDAALSQQPQSLTGLLLSSSTAPFPPPLGCYPGLDASQIQAINVTETTVFKLSPIRNTDQFDVSCYPDRPIYGVLDVLRLRLPFLDSRLNVARQAAVLNHDVAPRVVIHSGEALSSLPGSSDTTVTKTQLDPRQYGTLSQLNHVILNYLTAIPDTNVAIALAEYVLTSASTETPPPLNSSVLYRSIATIPAMEVAVFGSIGPSDISSAVSAFTTSSGSLFFGSDQGNAFRTWAITGCSTSIAWSESTFSPLIVRDNSFSDPAFNQTWTAVSTALHNNVQGVGLSNITEAFRQTRRFSPF